MCFSNGSSHEKLLGSYPRTLLRRTSTQVYFTNFAYISRATIFLEYLQYLILYACVKEKITEKSAVESILFKVTVWHYNLIPHQGVLIQQKIPLKTQCCRSQHYQMINVNLNLMHNILAKIWFVPLLWKKKRGFTQRYRTF